MHFSENDGICHEFIASFHFVHMQNLLACKVNFSILFKELLVTVKIVFYSVRGFLVVWF